MFVAESVHFYSVVADSPHHHSFCDRLATMKIFEEKTKKLLGMFQAFVVSPL